MANTEPWKILVVDDEADTALVTSLALKRRDWDGRGFAVTVATSCSDAKEKLAQQTFDVAIVDLIMETERAGLDVCQFVRETKRDATRLILRTGLNEPLTPLLSDATYGIDRVIAKGESTLDRLYEAVTACLQKTATMPLPSP